ncbi:hypothetical protein TWF703_000089 [Orbilia oligospora]|uniref:CHAT domain-containing protein n=1 Tax=Orbilia oligospora TaxID=2813651 RepID=A0A7C8JU41_ORBOL|nr:hypothetical protein TWF703_000089 [Orbilia oligospora]
MCDTLRLAQDEIEEKEQDLRELRHTGRIKELEHRQGSEQAVQIVKELELQIEVIRSAWTATEIEYESERFKREQKKRDLERHIKTSKKRLTLTSTKDTQTSDLVVDSARTEEKVESSYNDKEKVSVSMSLDTSLNEPQDIVKSDRSADITSDTTDNKEGTDNKTSSPIAVGLDPAAERAISLTQGPNYSLSTQNQSLAEGSTSKAPVNTVAYFKHSKAIERVSEISGNAYGDDELSDFVLKYYVEVDPREGGVELQFLGMAKEQLDEVANDLDAVLERDFEDTWLLGIIYYYRFLKTGSLDDIETAIKRTEEVLLGICTQVDDPNYVFYLKSLITMLMKKYWCTDSITDLNQAILRGEEMLTMGHCDYMHQILDLLKMKRMKVSKTGSFEEIEEMEVISEVILAEKRLDSQMNHGLANYSKTGDIKYLESALEVAGAEDHPLKPAVLFALSTFFKDKFDRTADFDDLKTAIKRVEEALDLNHHNNKLVVEMSLHLAQLFIDKFGITDDLINLEIAIQRTEGALVPNPTHSASGLLAKLLGTKFDRTGNLEDLLSAVGRAEEAVAAERNSTESVAEEGIDILLSNEEAKYSLLNTLGGHLATLFRWTGNLNDLNRAIVSFQKALDSITGSEDDTTIGSIQNNLAFCFGEMFQQTGNLEDLQMAISISERSIQLTSQGSTLMNRQNLSGFLAERFILTGNLDDLQTAIKMLQELMEILPQNDPDRPRYQSNLISFLETRYRRLGNLDDVQKAISLGQEDSPTIQGHLCRPGMLNNIAGCYLHRFRRTGDSEDLEISIKIIEEAISMTNDTIRKAFLVNGLAMILRERFEDTRNLDDLNRAIEASEEHIVAIPKDHYQRAASLLNLGRCAVAKFIETQNNTDYARALLAFEEAAQSSNADVNVRVSAARIAADMLAIQKSWIKASQMIEIGVKLLPLLTPRQLKQRDQQHKLKDFAGLASKAGSIALWAGKDANYALRLLELGRGIITNLRFGNRSDITELKIQHPELADNFERLRGLLDSSGLPDLSNPITIMNNLGHKPSDALDTDASNLLQRQKMDQLNNANMEFNKIVDRIRLLPNFENFLLPPKAEDLIAAACDLGTFVVINTSESRCDAFIVDKNGIRSLHLPRLRQEDIKSKVEFMRSVRSTYRPSLSRLKQIFGILEWLWDVAVCLILEALEFTSQPPPSIHEEDWPRVWWIPTGQLSLLPLHAAGRYSQGSTETTLDRVISSYSSSIKALIYSRYRHNPQDFREDTLVEASEEDDGEGLFVSMDKTPGQSDLSYVSQEISMLEGLLHHNTVAKTIKLERPCKKDVLERLAQGACKTFHFAGHGQSDPTDPSQSSLLVSDWKQNPLTVEDLIGLNLRQGFTAPWLAFLSACSTSDNNVDQLQDESINLVTGCQLAGFQHVVGTLWEVSDEHSVYAAEEVYKIISMVKNQLTGNSGAINARSIALGVHKASRRLQEMTTRKYRARDKFTESQATLNKSLEFENEACEIELGESPEHFGGLNDDERGTRASRRLRPLGFEEQDDDIPRSNPLIWAAYIHVGP